MAENMVSIQIPSADLNTMLGALKTITDLLKPYLISLTPAQRRELPKMSDKTAPFVEKVLDYAESNAKFSPAYLDLAALKIDVKAVSDLTQLFRLISQLYENLNDTIILAGSEAFVASLAYYNSVKQAAKMNITEAKTIYEDLKKRFEKQYAKEQPAE